MAALIHQRTEATYEVHESIKVDTQDHEDHTFCGIMFPVKCKNLLPLDHIVIRSVAVRGYLGPLTVWVHGGNDLQHESGNDDHKISRLFNAPKGEWTKIHDQVHAPSIRRYQSLELDPPIIMKPGDLLAIYVHSTLPGDRAIVYDNSPPQTRFKLNSPQRYDDDMISIYTARAHVSNTPFGHIAIWGRYNAWRDNREFVGELEYGALYQLWNPVAETRLRFGPNFTKSVYAMFMCQRRWESPVSMLPDECLFYILHMCRWDWFDDTKKTILTQNSQQKRKAIKPTRLKQHQQHQHHQRQQGREQKQQVSPSNCVSNDENDRNNNNNSRSISSNSEQTSAETTITNHRRSLSRRSLSRLDPKKFLRNLSKKKMFYFR